MLLYLEWKHVSTLSRWTENNNIFSCHVSSKFIFRFCEFLRIWKESSGSLPTNICSPFAKMLSKPNVELIQDRLIIFKRVTSTHLWDLHWQLKTKFCNSFADLPRYISKDISNLCHDSYRTQLQTNCRSKGFSHSKYRDPIYLPPVTEYAVLLFEHFFGLHAMLENLCNPYWGSDAQSKWNPWVTE